MNVVLALDDAQFICYTVIIHNHPADNNSPNANLTFHLYFHFAASTNFRGTSTMLQKIKRLLFVSLLVGLALILTFPP